MAGSAGSSAASGTAGMSGGNGGGSGGAWQEQFGLGRRWLSSKLCNWGAILVQLGAGERAGGHGKSRRTIPRFVAPAAGAKRM